MSAHPINPTRYPHLYVVAGRPVEHRSRDARHYHIERVPVIVTAAKIATTIAQVAIVGGMLLAILYGIYVLDIVVQP
jgi:hypothetical protein